jgi:membrane-bound acyltransferase YfiQ involved in biofilm formation
MQSIFIVEIGSCIHLKGTLFTSPIALLAYVSLQQSVSKIEFLVKVFGLIAKLRLQVSLNPTNLR